MFIAASRAAAQLPFQPTGRLLNISTRAFVGTGDEALIAGFVIVGAAPKEIVVRGIGPSLAGRGVSGALTQPTLELRDAAGALVAANSGWRASQEESITATGIAPADDREAALLQTLRPGSYTAIVRGATDTTGTALVEVYDLDSNGGSVLANVSTRGLVASADAPLIGGVIVADEGVPMNRIVGRALGPSLAALGVKDVLADPALEFRNSAGALVAANDDSENAEHSDVLADTGLLPGDGGESAITSVVGPGAYTAIVTSADGTPGIALVELFQLR